MKVFFDTNVLIAAYATQGSCHDLVSHCFAQHTVYLSNFVLKETENKLLHKIKLSADETSLIMTFLRKYCEIAEETKLFRHISRDHDDDHILAAALYGQVNCIVSGDKDLLVLKKIESIPILKPADFWKFEETHTI
jgi:putative PIN family toxin of toxin-antitoxin system